MTGIPYRLAVLATLLAALASAAGLGVTGLYHDAPNWVQQAQGTDLATLFLAVPLVAGEAVPVPVVAIIGVLGLASALLVIRAVIHPAWGHVGAGTLKARRP